MTTFYLVRHATFEGVGHRLAGRADGVNLDASGRAAAVRLGERLRRVPLEAVYTSPLSRTLETAQAICAPHGLAPRPLDALVEMDFGEWTGATVEALEDDEHWRRFNAFRSGTRIPSGELASEVQSRTVAALTRLCAAHPTQAVAIVSHAEVVRLLVAYYLGVPIDLAHRLDVAPASISILDVTEWGATLRAFNLASPD